MNAICLVIDRLHAGYAGCYGNAWIASPALNRLASEAFVFDQALIDRPDLNGVCESYWRGLHAMERTDGTTSDRWTLPGVLREAGIRATLMSDDPTVGSHALAGEFDQLIRLSPPGEARTAEEINQTHLAGVFAAAVDWLQSAAEPFCLWLYTQGLAAPWDAPLQLRNQYADEQEELPPELVEVPHYLLPKDFDPDQRLGICHAYAGQVSLLDLCIGGLTEFLRESPLGSNTLLVLVSARGLPLGEHRRIGAWDEVLQAELVHAVWLMRFPDGLGAAARSQALVQPPDLPLTLLDWWDVRRPAQHTTGLARSLLPLVRGEVETVRDRAAVIAPRERAIRTPAWYLRVADAPAATGEPTQQAWLYVKPDDRWEVNEVSDRCDQVVDALRHELTLLEAAARSGRTAELPPLAEELLSGF